MKRVANLIIVLCFSVGVLCSCGHVALAGEKNPEKARIEVELIQWQVKYYKEQMRSVALEYTGLCFKDKRYIKANQELERLDREIKQLLSK